VLADYANGRSALAVAESRALVVGDALTANIRRAPVLMSRFYKKLAALGLRDLLRAFDGELVSQIAIDYGRFKAQLKGASEETALATLEKDDAKIALPRVVYTANTNAIYPRLGEIAEPERSAVAIGFDAQGDEVVILTVEIDSKLEADRELTEFWCDRLEMVAVHCGFAQYRLWLITPEGFDSAALVVLAERNAYGSSRKQVALLSQLLNAAPAAKELSTAEEYEIVVPMGEDTEMISAHAVEDIAKRHDLPAKMINQIKTALVEACINAAEHSLSPDRKIHQKFTVDGEKLTITVSNRGLRLTDKKLPEDAGTAERRGWGLKLMKGLMDDVRLEQTDDGTSVTMIKYLSPNLAVKSAA
jgi:serine/threonine-protein kinase RsbW